MELDFDTPEIERSGNFDESFFGISDVSIILDILRNKMYSDPIKAICREVTCNARDAHREVGKFDTPIEVYLPTSLSPSLKIKDYGPGISPDRIANVFINYAASTKRTDNIQTGGFGLGAKTPFSYSDSFSIITNVDGIKYNYSCYIDESNIGKLVRLSSDKTEEPNGTEIIVPVKRTDFVAFSQAVKEYTEYWEVQPRVLGMHTDEKEKFENKNILLSGTFWKIFSTSNTYNYYARSSIIALIDGVPYPVDLNYFRNNKTVMEFSKSYRITAALNFEVGELAISANREQIYIENTKDNKSFKAIEDKLNAMYPALEKCVEDKIASSKSFLEAALVFKGLFSDMPCLSSLNPSFKNKKLDIQKSYPSVHCHHFTYDLKYVKDKDLQNMAAKDIDKFYSSNHPLTYLNKDKDKCLFIYDFGDKGISKIHALKIFKANKKYNQLVIIQVRKDDAELVKELQARYPGENFSKYYTRRTVTSKKNTSPTLVVFSFVGGRFYASSKKEYSECTNEKILCTINSDTLLVINNKIIEPRFLCQILTHFDNKGTKYSIFAVKDDIPDTKLVNLDEPSISLEDLISEYIDEVATSNIFLLIKYCKENNKLPHNYYNTQIFKPLNIDIVTNKSAVFFNYFKGQELIEKIEELTPLLPLYEAVSGKLDTTKLEHIYNDHKYLLDSYNDDYIHSRYPLLGMIDRYRLRDDNSSQAMIDYINLIEETKENKKCQAS